MLMAGAMGRAGQPRLASLSSGLKRANPTVAWTGGENRSGRRRDGWRGSMWEAKRTGAEVQLAAWSKLPGLSVTLAVLTCRARSCLPLIAPNTPLARGVAPGRSTGHIPQGLPVAYRRGRIKYFSSRAGIERGDETQTGRCSRYTTASTDGPRHPPPALAHPSQSSHAQRSGDPCSDIPAQPAHPACRQTGAMPRPGWLIYEDATAMRRSC